MLGTACLSHIVAESPTTRSISNSARISPFTLSDNIKAVSQNITSTGATSSADMEMKLESSSLTASGKQLNDL